MKSRGEQERFKHVNAEFQRIARRDKKAFLSNQCKEIEENNRIGKRAPHSSTLAWRVPWMEEPGAAVHGVAQSWTRLKQLNSSSRDLFKKIRDTKGIFHAKMGSIKDRNGLDLTEAEDIKKRC